MPRIEQLWAFVVDDNEPGDEWIPAIPGPGGFAIPLIGADMARVKDLRHIAQRMADNTGKAIHVLKFSVREEIETIEPRK